jgi:hypothetical protein
VLLKVLWWWQIQDGGGGVAGLDVGPVWAGVGLDFLLLFYFDLWAVYYARLL